MPKSANQKNFLSFFLAAAITVLTVSMLMPLITVSGQSGKSNSARFKERLQAVRDKKGNRFRIEKERQAKRPVSTEASKSQSLTQAERNSLLTGLPKELSLFENGEPGWPTFRLEEKHKDEGFDKPREAQEYRQYLEFLAASRMIEPGIEELDLEDLQGVHGLKALRVNVVLQPAADEVQVPEAIERAIREFSEAN
jgi:hypothetical protein